MQSSYRQITNFLLVVEGIGALFVTIYSIAYLLGLPSTTVYHSEPIFRITLSVLGVLLIALILGAAVTAAVLRRKY